MRSLHLLIIFSLLGSSNSFGDVYSESKVETKYIKVTISDQGENEKVSFNICDQTTNSCQHIGQQEYYSTNELIAKRKTEYLKAGIKAGVGVVVVGAAALGGIAVLGTSVGGSLIGPFAAIESGNTIGLALFGVTALAGGLYPSIVSKTKEVNPMHNWRIARAIRPDVIQDQNTQTPDIIKYAEQLDELLSQ